MGVGILCWCGVLVYVSVLVCGGFELLTLLLCL